MNDRSVFPMAVKTIKVKSENSHQFIFGMPGRGGGMRTLRSYSEHWGKEIPEEYKELQSEYFFSWFFGLCGGKNKLISKYE
jgi:hypothetical protein